MSGLRVMMARLRGLFSEASESRRLEEEITAHVNALAADHERRGLSPHQAHLAARREFGGITQVREQHRERRRLPFADSLAQDLRYTFRQICAKPGFSAAAILTLALGIGANTAIFRVLDAVVLRSLPVRNPEELMQAQFLNDGKQSAIPVAVFREIAARTRTLQDLSAAVDLTPQENAGAPPTKARLASGAYFQMLGVNARIGRVFTAADDQPSAAPVAVISYGYWQRQFAADPTVIARSITVNGASVSIAGVMGPEFFGEQVGSAPDVWLPMSLAPRLTGAETVGPSSAALRPMARLAAGVSKAHAQAEMTALYEQLYKLGMYMSDVKNRRVEIAPANQGLGTLRAKFSQPLGALMAIAALVLLIACCNLANLLLARAAARVHEIGVRLALGASRVRLLRQLLTESLALAAIGSALGLLLARWGSAVLVQMASAGQGWRLPLDTDVRILAFTIGVSAVAVCIFGIVPALAATRVDVNSALQANRRASAGSQSRTRTARAFVVAQIAIGLLLVTGAALLARSFWNIQRQDFGYRTQGILLVQIKNLSRVRPDFGRLDQAMNSIPGVQSAGVAGTGPLGSFTSVMALELPEQPGKAVADVRAAGVSPRYFETMGMPVMSGRGFDSGDRTGSTPVAVVTETAARRLFGAESAIGRSIRIQGTPAQQVQIAGVVRDLRFSGPRDPIGPVIFFPLAQHPSILTSVVLRTQGDPSTFAGAATQKLREIMPQLRPSAITAQPLDGVLAGMMTQERMVAELSAIFGLLALALASVGLYGVAAYAAERRTQEIGIRLALGARRSQVAGLLLGDLTLTLGSGLAVGIAGTFVLARWLGSLLFGLTPHDPLMLFCAAALLTAVALAAGYLPARRAARMDPMNALRQE